MAMVRTIVAAVGNPCPFCGEGACVMREGDTAYVECAKCHARGPDVCISEVSPEPQCFHEAVNLWATRE